MARCQVPLGRYRRPRPLWATISAGRVSLPAWQGAAPPPRGAGPRRTPRAWHLKVRASHGGQDELTEAARGASAPVRSLHGPPQQLGRPPIVALSPVRRPEADASAPAGRSPRARPRARGPLARRRWRLVVCRPWSRSTVDNRSRDLSQPTPVVQSAGQGLGLAQRREDAAQRCPVGTSAERKASRRSMACSLRIARLRQMWQSLEGLLEGLPPPRGARRVIGLLPRLPAVHQGLVPDLTPLGMVRQAFDLLGRAGREEASRGPRQCGRGARAAAPGAGCRRLPPASGRA